ncbi:diacylglycerol acyltransferase, partial [Conidiobolus coronatus NRRL 28638]
VFKIVRDYFDMKLIKTSDISSKKNNIFCYHPHGVVPFGMYCALNSNACGFDDLFPGIRLNMKGIAYNLIHPLLRELALYFGAQSISRESMLETLRVPGNSVGISVGGGAEMMLAVPNTAKLVIKNRFGFVKIALETGSDLVPVYAFGENEVYNQDPVDQKSFNFRIRRWLYKKTNFFLPSISGRGIFPNTKGIFPNNVPIRIVVGKPINVEKVDNPTDEQIKELHSKYCGELEALYNQYKDDFWYDSSTCPSKIEFLANPLK